MNEDCRVKPDNDKTHRGLLRCYAFFFTNFHFFSNLLPIFSFFFVNYSAGKIIPKKVALQSVKLDIVAEDIFRTEYNIEIQRADKGAGAKRIRYHQAMLDSHTLKKQEAFETLPNLYIIFILEHDIFGRNEPVYSVTKSLNIKDEDGNNLLFDDGCNIMYINGEYRGDDALGRLMHDFSTPNADEMIYDRLAEKVRFYKQNETGVQMASKIVEEYGDERAAEAFKQGTQQKAIEDAIAFLKEGAPPEKIARCTKLPLEKVLELQKQIPEKA